MAADLTRFDRDPDALAQTQAKAQALEAVPVAAVFGRRARALREERGWSLMAMAARPGLNIAAIRRVERGDDVRLSTAEKVAAAFGKSLAEMLAAEVPE